MSKEWWVPASVLDVTHAGTDRLVHVVEKSELDAAKAEIAEQCRLNGIGQERELKLMAELDAALAKIARLEAALEQIRDLVDTDHVKTESDSGEIEYWINDAEVKSICEEALS